jgi:sentrin-specific protease 1
MNEGLLEIHIKVEERKRVMGMPYLKMEDLRSTVEEIFKLEHVNDKYKIEVDGSDIRRLKAGEWLNDRIINFYFQMIKEHSLEKGIKVYIFSTFFYHFLTLKGTHYISRWTEDSDIFANDFIFIPIHLTNHWVFCCVDLRRNEIEYYDSLKRKREGVIIRILEYLKFESKKREREKRRFKTYFRKNIPVQQNMDDCGVFVCMYSKNRVDDRIISFQPEDIPKMRMMMVHEIFIGKILYGIGHEFEDQNG